ncbi:MAG: arginine N-succinyltransferase [Myxococcales bacterium]|nr:arginine N-succinyltransferase [Myxococcales bacterium]
MLILRPIAESDLDALVDLARQLDSLNLPSDRDFLERRIDASLRSFAAAQRDGGANGGATRQDWRKAVYVFVLEDTAARRGVGTSTIIAKQGVPDAPYFWLAVTSEERRSTLLDRRFVHSKLHLLSTEDGPTEVGGLILDPAYRCHADKCGKALSIVRFAYISRYPERFERDVIAEMLSPFEESGENLLWNAFGAKFTGLAYREADRLSARSKQFIADLFPRDPVYSTLFPESVQATIGKTTAAAAVAILEKVGFRYLHQVDPFDGGPYYGAARNAISSVRDRRRLVLPGLPFEGIVPAEGTLALLSAEGQLGFRATVVPLDPEGAPLVSKACREALGVAAGDEVLVTPLP